MNVVEGLNIPWFTVDEVIHNLREMRILESIFRVKLPPPLHCEDPETYPSLIIKNLSCEGGTGFLEEPCHCSSLDLNLGPVTQLGTLKAMGLTGSQSGRGYKGKMCALTIKEQE